MVRVCPGINDPTTAQDAMFHLGSVLHELLVRVPPARVRSGPDDRTVILAQNPTHAELVGLAFDEVRLAAGGQPTVQIYLLELAHLLVTSLDRLGFQEACEALRLQAQLMVEVSRLADLPPHDHQRVEEAYEKRFGVNTRSA